MRKRQWQRLTLTVIHCIVILSLIVPLPPEQISRWHRTKIARVIRYIKWFSTECRYVRNKPIPVTNHSEKNCATNQSEFKGDQMQHDSSSPEKCVQTNHNCPLSKVSEPIKLPSQIHNQSKCELLLTLNRKPLWTPTLNVSWCNQIRNRSATLKSISMNRDNRCQLHS